MGKWSILRELWLYVRVRKKWWLLPIVLLLLLLSALIVLTGSSSLAPLLYPLF
jgi:hypothetical protein